VRNGPTVVERAFKVTVSGDEIDGLWVPGVEWSVKEGDDRDQP
jgi:hypothetical protein